MTSDSEKTSDDYTKIVLELNTYEHNEFSEMLLMAIMSGSQKVNKMKQFIEAALPGFQTLATEDWQADALTKKVQEQNQMMRDVMVALEVAECCLTKEHHEQLAEHRLKDNS